MSETQKKEQNFKPSAATLAIQGELQQKTGELKTFMDQNRDGNGSLKHEVLKAVRDRDAELNTLGEKLESSRAIDAIEAKVAGANRLPSPTDHPKGGPEEPGTDVKSLGEMFTESAEYKARAEGQTVRAALKSVSVDNTGPAAIKTLMTTSAGFAPANNRGPVVIPFAVRRPMIGDLIPQNPTDNSVIRYMQETTFTNNAAPTAEGAAKPQSALAFTEVQAPLQVIAHWIPVTEQQLRYVPQVRALVDGRLVIMLKLVEENELLNGSGTAPHLAGFLTTTGVQSYAQGTTPNTTENIVDAFYRAITNIRSSAFTEPDAAVINPNDWIKVRLLKTTQGAYIYGNPDEAGPERMWGKPCVITTAITAGTGLVGDFSVFSHIDRSLDYTVQAGWQNDDFVKNQLTLRAETWLALEIYRPSAFSKVTALA